MPAIALVSLACATRAADDRLEPGHPPSTPVAGAPGDFKTAPGRYDGYDVIPCWNRSCGGIVGTGHKWPPGMERGPEHSDSVYQRSFQGFRAELTAALKGDVPSLDTSGLSRSCGADGIETVFWLHDWRELDAALASAGHFLKARDLKERISFCVMPYSPSVEE